MLKYLFNHNRSPGTALLICSLVLTVAACGCGKAKSPWEKAYPAKGVVNFKGKPVGEAQITLVPEDASFPDSIRPRAKSNADGTFDVWTFSPGDGAPAGKYKVLVVHRPVFVSPEGAITTKPNDLPKKYSALDTTDLIVEIAQGETQIPLDLK